MSELFSTERMFRTNSRAIDDLLKDCLQLIHRYHSVEGVYFDLLYKTGCRPGEPLNIKNWARLENGIIGLTMPKTGAVREMRMGDLSNVWIHCVDCQIDLFHRYNYQHMLRIYKTYSRLNGAVRKETLIQLYIFRHNKVKQLIDSGMKPEKVNEYFAWMDEDVYKEYAKSHIYI